MNTIDGEPMSDFNALRSNHLALAAIWDSQIDFNGGRRCFAFGSASL
ncbi:MAG: hypothetical protein GY895_12520 [Phycisphaera sp.]|nr:hypothetical protein [Phycisphaera sp.]